MTDLKCMACNTQMIQVPVDFLEEMKFLTTKYLCLGVLLSIEIAKRNNATIEVFLCPPHLGGCGDQSAIVGPMEEEE